jgi:hypothetical protein
MSSLLSGTRLHYTSFSIPGDELQTWSKEELETQNSRFVAALERAFALGLESRASAAGQVALPASSSVRLSSPLCPAHGTPCFGRQCRAEPCSSLEGDLAHLTQAAVCLLRLALAKVAAGIAPARPAAGLPVAPHMVRGIHSAD